MSRTVGYGTIEERSTGEEELRARARERVVGAARQGHQPRARHTEEDLRWAFRDREDELAELEDLAARTRDQQAERQRSIEQGRGLQAMTAKVLQEWDEQRRRDAELEARRRLGYDEAD